MVYVCVCVWAYVTIYVWLEWVCVEVSLLPKTVLLFQRNCNDQKTSMLIYMIGETPQLL